MFRAKNSSQIHQTSVIIRARDTLYRHICVAENYNWDINSTNIKNKKMWKWHWNMSITAWGGADSTFNVPDATSQKTTYN